MRSLQRHYGKGFTNKLKHIFADAETAQQLAVAAESGYRTRVLAVSALSWTHALFDAKNCGLRPHRALEACGANAFAEAYSARFAHRTVRFLGGVGVAEVEFRCHKRLLVNTF